MNSTRGVVVFLQAGLVNKHFLVQIRLYHHKKMLMQIKLSMFF
ncbi:MAG: hypothetical protein ACYTF1_24210 [Planctomycetota bacterium]|jgi:hypothetical protein